MSVLEVDRLRKLAGLLKEEVEETVTETTETVAEKTVEESQLAEGSGNWGAYYDLQVKMHEIADALSDIGNTEPKVLRNEIEALAVQIADLAVDVAALRDKSASLANTRPQKLKK